VIFSLAIAAAMLRPAPQAPPPPRVYPARATFGRVYVAKASDVRRAVGEGVAAKAAAFRFLGLRAPPFVIVDQNLPAAVRSRANGALLYLWPFSAASGSGAGGLSTDTLLRHEIGHDLFMRFVMPRTRDDEYGGDAPDWLDEMAAVAFEDEAETATRRGDARLRVEHGTLIPLARLLSMTHPEWQPGTGRPPGARGAVAFQPRSAETGRFYATVRVLLDLLVDRVATERVIPLLAAEARAGRPLDAWLLDHAARGGRAAGLAGLDSEISAFVLSDPRYTKAGLDVGRGVAGR
jgi:hypothetical protein